MSPLLKSLSLKRTVNSPPPIWLMRQVGRFLPEYKKLKGKKSLFSLFHKEEAIVSATLMGPKLLKTDAAIIFSDIFYIFDGLNISYDFIESIGPKLTSSFQQLNLDNLNPDSFSSLLKSIKILKRELSVPLIGFSGSPFTLLACLLSEGMPTNQRKIAPLLYGNTKQFDFLIETLTQAITTYLEYQIKAGVDVIQLFDSLSYLLPSNLLSKYVVRTNKKIISSLKKYNIPFIFFCKNSSFYPSELLEIKATCLSFDSQLPLSKISQSLPNTISIQGNLDPGVLFGPKTFIKKEVSAILKTMNSHPGYIFNLGHGILPETPVSNVKFLIDYVKHSLY